MKYTSVQIKRKKSILLLTHSYSVSEHELLELQNGFMYSIKIIEWLIDKAYCIDNTQVLSVKQLCGLLVKYYGAKYLLHSKNKLNKLNYKQVDILLYEETNVNLRNQQHYDRVLYRKGIYANIYQFLNINKKLGYCDIQRVPRVDNDILVIRKLNNELNSKNLCG